MGTGRTVSRDSEMSAICARILPELYYPYPRLEKMQSNLKGFHSWRVLSFSGMGNVHGILTEHLQSRTNIFAAANYHTLGHRQLWMLPSHDQETQDRLQVEKGSDFGEDSGVLFVAHSVR